VEVNTSRSYHNINNHEICNPLPHIAISPFLSSEPEKKCFQVMNGMDLNGLPDKTEKTPKRKILRTLFGEKKTKVVKIGKPLVKVLWMGKNWPWVTIMGLSERSLTTYGTANSITLYIQIGIS
jgi:hypothetical protein